MPARILLDEHVDVELALRLETNGYDVQKAQETEVAGLSDDVLLLYAAAHERILYTHNIRDFKPLSEQWGRDHRVHAGLIYSSLDQPAVLYQWLVSALKLYPDMTDLTISLPIAS